MGPELAPMIVMTTGIITTGAVLILRPISKRLGRLLEVMAEQRLRPAPPPPPVDMSQIRDLLTGIDHRLSVMEERQDFAEALLSSGETRAMVPAPQERN
ncbi:MAG TPA: hypothetical protein VF705_05560 [Longimicrobium sp.]|jgi:hypothetical protein